jgi:sterol desaturase/sphingolipid hydroxylase (fatty acid hydroxylase superfamily)
MSWIKYQAGWQWMLFAATFLAVAIWETVSQRRPLNWPAERRWANHALLLILSTIVGFLVFRLSAVAVAGMTAASGFGLLNKPWLPFALQWACAIFVLDFIHYGTHRAFHSVPILWRIHEVHHSDPDYDVSTAARFHPLESLADRAVFLTGVVLLAPPPVAVFSTDLISTALNAFVHANASLPDSVERFSRRFIITPDMHRIHHSEELDGQAANFGQIFCCWDRLFGTYQRGQSRGQSITTGIKGLQNARSLEIGFMLREPFRQTD